MTKKLCFNCICKFQLCKELKTRDYLNLGDDIIHEDIRECFNCYRFY